jgi:hypothetical protein
MQAKDLVLNAGRRKTCVLTALILMLGGIVFAPNPATWGREGSGVSAPQGANKPGKISLSVKNPRPLAEAILMLEAQYGWIITYEDPRYAYAGDLEDVTEKVSTNLDQYPKAGAPRVLFPKEGELTFQYPVGDKTSPLDPVLVVRQLLAAQAASTNAGRFRMEKDGQMIHIIPYGSINP